MQADLGVCTSPSANAGTATAIPERSVAPAASAAIAFLFNIIKPQSLYGFALNISTKQGILGDLAPIFGL